MNKSLSYMYEYGSGFFCEDYIFLSAQVQVKSITFNIKVLPWALWYFYCMSIDAGGELCLLKALVNPGLSQLAKTTALKIRPPVFKTFWITQLKLHSDDREVFLETLGEVTGRTPAQVMADLFNMNATQASALCKALWLVADDIRGDPAVFVPMVSSLTGQPEAMMRQCLNGSRDENEDQEKGDQQLQEARTFDQQRGIYAVSPSLM